MAVVDEGKIVDYLLSTQHPAGRSKARFFAQFGFERESWNILADALKEHARINPVALVAATQFGVKYTIDGPIETPTGSRPNIRSIWIVEPGEPSPRLVTAHPL